MVNDDESLVLPAHHRGPRSGTRGPICSLIFSTLDGISGTFSILPCQMPRVQESEV